MANRISGFFARRGGDFDEASFLRALEDTVPERVLRREEPALRARATLLQAYGELALEPEKAGHKKRRLVTAPRALAGSAVMVAIGLVLFLTLAGPGTFAKLHVHRGEVAVYRVGDETPMVTSGELELRDDDRVVASGDALASITTHENDGTRLEGSTELTIDRLDEDGKVFVHRTGRSYHHSSTSYDYGVVLGEIEITKANEGECAFCTDFDREMARTRVIEGKVAVTVGSAGTLFVCEGEELLAGEIGGEYEVTVAGYNPQVLEEPWYQWNLQRDQEDQREQDGGPEGESEPEQETGETTEEETEPDPANDPEPEPDEGNLALQYMCANADASDNQITPHFKIVNNTGDDIPLSEYTIRYWYTVDGERPQNFWCDWARVGSANVGGAFHKLGSAADGADYYLEVSFAPGAGTIAPGGDSGDVQCRFAKNDWTVYSENGDYSYYPATSGYTESSRITLYRNGVLVWGIEPGDK
ncbi:MAG: cellulose binding domain-containing protein [Actinomycetota bacterium]|nr:cellulose binding domain-containing protein [Actinomycetota bacterium]